MLLSLPDPPQPLATPAPLAVLASGRGSNLAAIADAITSGALAARIVLVVCNVPGAGVIEVARSLNIECIVLPHQGFVGGRAAYDAALAALLKRRGARWVVMAGWMRIATSALLDAFPDRVLNLHPSLLPSFPGLHAAQQALDAGVCITGCTVHYVAQAVDAGPIIAQAAVRVLPQDDLSALTQRIQLAEHTLYPRAIAHALSQETSP